MTNIRRFCSNCGGEKILAAREGAAEGGCGGNSAAPERSAERSEAVQKSTSGFSLKKVRISFRV